MTHGRDTFGVMESVTTSFGKQNRLSISRNLAIFLVIVFVVSVAGTAVLVYHLSACAESRKDIPNIIYLESNNRTPVLKAVPEEEIAVIVTTIAHDTTTTRELETAKITDVRLPESIKPLSYEIKLVPFIFEGNFTFRGEVTVLISASDPTDCVTLHADQLTIDETAVKVYEELQGKTVPIAEIGNDTDRQFLHIHLAAPLDTSKRYYVHIEFEGVLNDLMHGFYRSSYMLNNQIRWIAVTQFQPTDARKAFPCFDEPALKAMFKMSIARPMNMTSVSNMPRVATEFFDGIDEYEWDHYAESVPMSTYLLAFAVFDFEYIRNGNFSVWARRDALPQARYGLEFGPKVLKFFEDFFQIPFPLPKVDMVAIPDFAAGAMENWGLITYRESTVLSEEGVTSRMNLQRISIIIAHELAHQWFGNLVTPKWWTDLWLNEGFATYMEYIGTDAVMPSWKVMDQFVISELQNVFTLDALKSSHQISIEVYNPSEIDDIFDKISYAKGASLIRMMENFLSSNVFRKGLANYLNERKFSNAEQDDLWHALTEQAHQDEVLQPEFTIKEIMDTWTLQTGFPVVTVTRSYEEGFANFKQERFFVENNPNDLGLSLWWIPITFLTGNATEIKSAWMRAEPEITLSDLHLLQEEWFLVNVEQKGYYRVNYDHKNWQLLTQQLLKPEGFAKFSSLNRAQMIDDSLNLAASGYLDYDIALNVTRYLVFEKEFVPWTSAFMSLTYLQDMMTRSADFDKYKSYMLSLMGGLYQDVGFEDSPRDPQLTVYNRVNVLRKACQLGNLDCIRNAVTHFYNWKASPNPDQYNPISPNLKNVVYCMAIRAGGQEEWDFAWQRYLNTNVGSEKEIILSALGCTRETWLLSRYLHRAITEGSGIRKQDAGIVFSAVSSNSVGQELAYRFLKTHWGDLKKYMGSSLLMLNDIVKHCTSKFNTQDELDDLRNFVSNNKEELSIVTRVLEQSIEQSEANVRWMNKYYHKIVRWLSAYKSVV